MPKIALYVDLVLSLIQLLQSFHLPYWISEGQSISYNSIFDFGSS